MNRLAIFQRHDARNALLRFGRKSRTVPKANASSVGGTSRATTVCQDSGTCVAPAPRNSGCPYAKVSSARVNSFRERSRLLPRNRRFTAGVVLRAHLEIYGVKPILSTKSMKRCGGCLLLGLASGIDSNIGVPSATHGHGVNEQREGPPCLTGRA